MEFNKVEVSVVEKVVVEANEMEIRELNEMQLACIGGGIGDVAWG